MPARISGHQVEITQAADLRGEKNQLLIILRPDKLTLVVSYRLSPKRFDSTEGRSVHAL